MPQIFLDMDGVLADFDGRFKAISGRDAREFENDEGATALWRIVYSTKRYFADLDLMPDARALYEGVAHLRPIILTGCPRDPGVPDQKREWAARHFPGVPVVCTASAAKRDCCQPGDVLIDDWFKYRHLWEGAGGTFILHKSAKLSLAELWALHPDLKPVTRSIIGFTGQKGAGKDTAAGALDGFEKVKMAGALKSMLAALLRYQGAHQTEIDRMLEGDLKEVPTPLLAGRTPRHAMVTLGTEWGRDLIDGDLWIGVAERRIALFDRVCVTDVRFPNEVEMVRRLGGRVFRIERECLGAPDAHPSEALIASLEVDGVIPNTSPSPEAFASRVAEMIGA